jgi:hypothetical protein
MKIEPSSPGKKDKYKSKKTAEKGDIGFIDAIISSEKAIEDSLPVDPDSADEDEIKNLADTINALGDNLSKNPTPENFMQYKEHIRLFLTIIKKNLEVKNKMIRVNISRHKLFQVIETVDERLGRLAQMVMSKEKKRIEYLQLTSSIKGILINLIT